MEAAIGRRMLFKLFRENRAALVLYPLILGVLLPMALAIPRPYENLAQALFFGMVMIAGPFMLPCATIILAFMGGYMVVAPGQLFHAEVLPVRRIHLLLYYFLPSFLFFTLMGFVGAWVTYHDMENIHPSRYYAWPMLFASAYLLGLAASLMSDKAGKQQPYWRIVVFPIVLIIGAFVNQGLEDPEFLFPSDVVIEYLWVIGFTVAALYANSDRQRRILRWSALGLFLIAVVLATRTDIAQFIASRGGLKVNALTIGGIRSSNSLITLESSYDSSGFDSSRNFRNLEALNSSLQNRDVTWYLKDARTNKTISGKLDVLMQPVAVGNTGNVLLSRPADDFRSYILYSWDIKTNQLAQVAQIPFRVRSLQIIDYYTHASPDAKYLLLMLPARYGADQDLWLVDVSNKSIHLLLPNQKMLSSAVRWADGNAYIGTAGLPVIVDLESAKAEALDLKGDNR